MFDIDIEIIRFEADLWRQFSQGCCGMALLWGLIGLVVSAFNLTPAFLVIAIGFLFAMRAVSASRRADSLYARAAAAALAEGDDPIAMSEAA